MSDDLRLDRREALLSLGRYLVAGAIAVGAGLLTARPGDACAYPGVCADCPALEGCALPQAGAARQDRQRSGQLSDCERP